MNALRFDHTIHGSRIKATDGEIGHCSDLLFDERFWTARYVVVKTGPWLFGREVLVPIVAVDGFDPDSGEVEVCLTMEEIRNAPDIDTDAPVSRRHEIRINDYYAYSYYWAMGNVWGAGLDPAALRSPLDEPEGRIPPVNEGDPSLRSLTEIVGYQIRTREDDIATVVDAYVCPPTWYVSYLVLKTGGWLSRDRVLMAPDWTSAISWSDRVISTDLSAEEIEAAPAFDPPLTREYEEALKAHYEQQTRMGQAASSH